jgi:hypothetical protein
MYLSVYIYICIYILCTRTQEDDVDESIVGEGRPVHRSILNHQGQPNRHTQSSEREVRYQVSVHMDKDDGSRRKVLTKQLVVVSCI